ncbi:MAG: hypothetical protein ACYS0H_28960, partial [Planctomycetota bacterium]
YKDWKADPRAFDRIRVTLTDLGIRFDSVEAAVPGLDESAVLVLAGADQDDDAVGRTIGNFVYAEPYEKAKIHTISYGRFDRPDPEPWTFKDALGNPIPEASVEIFLRDFSGKAEIYVDKSSTDERGRLVIPNLDGSLRHLGFVVSHPDYGVAKVTRYLRETTKMVVPSVSRSTEAYQRCARGTVMDPEGNPVSGARIQCTNIRTLGEGLINGLHGWAYEALTDKEGTFSLYLPNKKRRDERGYLIPPKSKYNVRIEAPKGLGLLPYVKPIENDRHAAIMLERGGRFRTFAFEDANGVITDPRKLQYIGVTVHRLDQSRVSVGYDDFKDGGIFPTGQYRATMYGMEEHEFEPLTVDEFSPDELIFKLPDSILYHGKIVHGLTGEPMPGAFVMGMLGQGRGNLSMITPEQWKALHALPVESSPDDPVLKPLREIYIFKKLVRTDELGYFEMSLRPGEVYGFVAFEESYLGLMRRRHALVPDQNRRAALPVMKLFPAATLLVELLTKERVSVCPRWIVDKDNNSVWVREFLATDDNRESQFTYRAWLEENELQSFHVPAGLNLRVKFDAPYDRKWCPIEIPQVFNLSQGQVVDLASHTFHPALAVSVYVTNMQGEPVEGVPVRAMRERNHWSVPHNTDESGTARFHVVPHSDGQFGVLYHGKDGLNLKETIPYKMAGEEEAGRRFMMQLSDDILYHLFKSDSL